MTTTNGKYGRLAMFAIILFYIETTIDGTGRLIDYGFISIQMVLFAFACVATLNPLFKDFKNAMLNPNVIVAIVFAIAVIICAYIGIKKGNEGTYIRTDITSVMTLALLPGFLATVNDSDKLKKIIKVFFVAISCAAVIQVIFFLLCAFIDDDTIKSINIILEKTGAAISSGRQDWRIAGLYIPGMIIGIYFLRDAKDYRRVFIYIFEACMLFGLIISLTRSKWLGLAAACLLLLLLRPKDIKKYLLNGIVTLAVFLLIVAISSFCYGELMVIPELTGRVSDTVEGVETSGKHDDQELTNELNKILEESDDEDLSAEDLPDGVIDNKSYIMHALGSDALRKIIISRHIKGIKENFIIGEGLGMKLGKQWEGKSEYMYLDFLQKMGIIGFITFILAFLCRYFYISEIEQNTIARKNTSAQSILYPDILDLR